MTALEMQMVVKCVLGIIAFVVSFIPECVLLKYEDINKAPIILKIYAVIHIGTIIAIVAYLNLLRPSDIYLGI